MSDNIHDLIKNKFLTALRDFINGKIDIDMLYRAQKHLEIANNDYQEFMTQKRNLKFNFFNNLHRRLLNIERLCEKSDIDVDKELIKKHSLIVGLARRVLANDKGSFPAFPTKEMLYKEE
ncbi:hypothetical protein DMUE_1103 [Dictyocoela muelleri]|nr:hypothetical protein DMUE_1103 [Dictyocoela muelleri]